MRKIIIVAILAFITSSTAAQKHVKLYNKGVELFKQEKYKEADSLFSLAIKKRPKEYRNTDMYFDRGITRFYLSDTCGYCNDMKSAADLADHEAKARYMKFCLKYNDEANKYYKKGYHEFTLKNYKASDSLLTLSIESFGFVENIFLRGIAKFYMLDTNSFCSDMKKIYNINDQAKQNFQEICKTNTKNKIFASDYRVDTDEDKEEVYLVVEDMPTFNNSDNSAFRIYIQENLRYPVQAQEKGIEGRVFVQFDVDKNGEVKNAVIVRGVAEILDNEVLRVVNSSPKWKPGYQRNEPVTVRFTFPVAFQIKK